MAAATVPPSVRSARCFPRRKHGRLRRSLTSLGPGQAGRGPRRRREGTGARPAAAGSPGRPRQHTADRGQAPRRVGGGRRSGRQHPALLGRTPREGPRADGRPQGPARGGSRGVRRRGRRVVRRLLHRPRLLRDRGGRVRRSRRRPRAARRRRGGPGRHHLTHSSEQPAARTARERSVMTNMAQHLLDTAIKEGGRPALRMGDALVTYDEFADSAGRVAAALAARGVVPGDRVGLVLPNVPSFPLIYYGALMTGATVVPMNPLLKAREIDYYLRDSGARLVVAAEPSARPAAEAAEAVGIPVVAVDAVRPESLMADRALSEPVLRAEDDDAVLLYTSGTTGPPKGAELTHANLSGNARATSDTLLESTPDDVIMGCLPLFHVFGLTCGLNAAVLTSSALRLLPRFDGAAALAVIARDRVTVFEGVPTMFSAMLHAPGAADV